MAKVASGQVHKVIRVVATSSASWEDAARRGVGEAVKTIHDLSTASVVEADAVVRDGELRYRVKLEMAFQLDRSRHDDRSETSVQVKRYLILANQTLPSPGLRELIEEKVATGHCEFHILVPEGPRSSVYHDMSGTLDPRLNEVDDRDRLVALDEAEERLDSFRASFAHLDAPLTGEVGVGDPMAAVRRVMDRSTFDEIIVSTLPTGISRWLKLDLPARLQRIFRLPVTHLVQDSA